MGVVLCLLHTYRSGSVISAFSDELRMIQVWDETVGMSIRGHLKVPLHPRHEQTGYHAARTLPSHGCEPVVRSYRVEVTGEANA